MAKEDRFTSFGGDVTWDTPDGKPPRKKIDYRAETKRIIKKKSGKKEK